MVQDSDADCFQYGVGLKLTVANNQNDDGDYVPVPATSNNIIVMSPETLHYVKSPIQGPRITLSVFW